MATESTRSFKCDMDQHYDLIIKGGRLIDPCSGIDRLGDVGITADRIVTTGGDLHPAHTTKILDASQAIICPGLIDIHVHIGKHVTEIGVPVDTAGVFSGVTTLCDAGSAGRYNFRQLLLNDLQGHQTQAFSFINLCPEGLHFFPEQWDADELNPDETIALIESNRETIKGLKIRATGSFINKIGIKGISLAKEICRQTGLPLMVHVGIEPHEKVQEALLNNFTRQMIDYLDSGDIISHAFTAKDGGPIRFDGACDETLFSAVKRGVLLDAAIARTNFNIKIFKRAKKHGILPDLISTDLCTLNINETVFNMGYTMSKFLGLGMSLPDIVKMTTLNPARALGIQQGRIAEGAVADITVLSNFKGSFQYDDGPWGNCFKSNELLMPIFTVKKGVVIDPTICTGFIEAIRNGSHCINGGL